jgi:hypothetical protein
VSASGGTWSQLAQRPIAGRPPPGRAGCLGMVAIVHIDVRRNHGDGMQADPGESWVLDIVGVAALVPRVRTGVGPDRRVGLPV